jgi:hypothetical protein
MSHGYTREIELTGREAELNAREDEVGQREAEVSRQESKIKWQIERNESILLYLQNYYQELKEACINMNYTIQQLNQIKPPRELN